MQGMKIQYVETEPVKQEIFFKDREKFSKFLDKRIRGCVTRNKRLVYERFLLNKNGKPRKTIDPAWLHSPASYKKQTENFRKYQEKRIHAKTALRDEAIDLLRKNGFEFKSVQFAYLKKK